MRSYRHTLRCLQHETTPAQDLISIETKLETGMRTGKVVHRRDGWCALVQLSHVCHNREMGFQNVVHRVGRVGQCHREPSPVLLDEADVFVVERGNNIEQNVTVAEFLRTLEYFDGLLFMTTNRPAEIDEALTSSPPLAGGHRLRGKDGDSSRETLMPGRENALFGDVQSARLNSFLPSERWPEDLSMTISIIPMPFEN